MIPEYTVDKRHADGWRRVCIVRAESVQKAWRMAMLLERRIQIVEDFACSPTYIHWHLGHNITKRFYAKLTRIK